MPSEYTRLYDQHDLQVFSELVETLSNTTMYILQRCGPTSFTVKEESRGEQHHVTIGALQTCTCRRSTKSASIELCRHIVFVMVKVLGVPKDSPLAWQLSLVGKLPRASYVQQQHTCTMQFLPFCRSRAR